MNIVLCFDDSYSSHAAVVIESVCENNIGLHNFFVLTDYVSDKNKKKIREITDKFGCNLSFYNVDKSKFKNFPIGKGTANTYVSLATYFRLFITDYIPKEIARVLYLDCDIVVNGNLEDFYNHQFQDDNCIYALEESPILSISGSKRLGYPMKQSYFNAGVLLIDMQAFRKSYTLTKSIDYIKSHNILFHDQDVLNGMFHDKKEFMPLRYNVMDYFYIKHAIFAERYKREYENTIRNPVIIHYSGPLKPWHIECKNPLKMLYYEYLSRTSYANEYATYKYSTCTVKLKFYFKEMAKWILETLHIRYYSFIKL